MQIVIDIDEKRFKDIQRIASVQLSSNYFSSCEQIIARGTPLPKGHGRLIEVTNQLEQELFTYTRYTGIDEYPYESANLDDAPTIIEQDKEDA